MQLQRRHAKSENTGPSRNPRADSRHLERAQSPGPSNLAAKLAHSLRVLSRRELGDTNFDDDGFPDDDDGFPDDDDGFPDIRQKPGTPSDSFGGAYGPPDSDSESGYSRPGTAGSGESGSASLTFEDWQKKAGLGSTGGEDEFSKTDGSARDARRRGTGRAGRGRRARLFRCENLLLEAGGARGRRGVKW